MLRRPLVVAVLAALIAGLAAIPAASGHSAPAPTDVLSMISVDAPTRAARQRLQELGLDAADHSDPTHVAIVATAADLTKLRQAGFTYRVLVADLAKREAQRVALDAAYAAAADSVAMPSGRKAYRSLADYEHDLRQLSVDDPGLVKLIALPYKTLEGRVVHGIEITDHVQAKDAKPVFVLLGIHHAREWPSGEHSMEFAYDLVKTWNAGDARTRDLLGRARVIIVPVVNPDGYNVSFESAKVVDGRELQSSDTRGDGNDYFVIQQGPQSAYKRKNCRMVDGQTTPAGSCTAPGSRYLGVDDNRNYGALWGGAGASAFPGDDIYRGAAPFSEPETQNIRALISHRQVTMMVTQHTFAGLVLRAPGVKDYGVTVDEPVMADIGARMAAANGSVSEPGYQLYDTTGTTEDWSYGATGGFGYTFELPVREFHPPYAETVANWYGTGKQAGRGNREALYIALTTAADSRYHSIIAADAPKGAVLRLQKSFETATSPVRTGETQFTSDDSAGPALHFRDSIDTTTVSDGHVEWHVNPSTRPAVMERRVYDVLPTPIRTTTKSGTAPAVGEHTDVPFTLTRDDASARLEVDLDWPTPDDLDLEVYRRDGSHLTLVGSSGNEPGSKEQVSIDDPVPADYVLRVINYTSVAPSYTLSTKTFRRGVTKVHPALVPFEQWTLTCLTPTGTVLQMANVLVSRGDRVVVDLAECRRRWPS